MEKKKKVKKEAATAAIATTETAAIETEVNPTTVAQAAKEFANGREYTSVKIDRSFSHKQQLASPGYVFYKYSYIIGVKRNGVRTDGAVQIALSYEKRVGEEAVKDYVTRKYILKLKDAAE